MGRPRLCYRRAVAGPDGAALDALEVAIEGAQGALRALEGAEPEPSTLPAARALRRGIEALLDAYDHRATRREALGRAGGSLAFAVASLGAGAVEGDHARASEGALAAARATAEAARTWDDEALDAAPSARPAPFQISVGAPRCQALARPSLRPPGDVALEPPEPTPSAPPLPALDEDEEIPGLDAAALLAQAERLGRDAAALAAAAEDQARRIVSGLGADEPLGPEPLEDPGEVPAPGALLRAAPRHQDEAAFLRAQARDLLEDVGMFGVQRFPLFGDDWRDLAAVEQRLLDAADALLGLGPAVLPELERLARDAPAPDPMRAFGLAFALGSLEGRDALAVVERVLHRWSADDGAARAFESALSLAPSPLLPTVLRSLARSADPAARAVAIGALAQRGDAPLELLVDAVEDPDPRVVAAALPAIGATRHAHAGAVLSRARERAEPSVQVALWDGLARLGSPAAAELPLAALGGALADPAALALGVAARPAEARALLARAEASPSPALLAALGWAGSATALPLLLDALSVDDLALAAARALHRLLGGGPELLDAWGLDPESLEALEPRLFSIPTPALPGEEALEDASPDRHVLPTRDVDRWRARAKEVRTDGVARLRHGEPYAPHAALAELGRSGEPYLPSFWERQLLHRELCLWSGRYAHFDARAWVEEQERALVAWGQALGSGRKA